MEELALLVIPQVCEKPEAAVMKGRSGEARIEVD
jgi:hypothetical protein